MGASADVQPPMAQEIPDDVGPTPDDSALDTDRDIEAAVQKVENAKQISKEAFTKGLRRLLNLSIEGYPRALRSTMGRRNAILREHAGNQDNAVDDVKAQAGALTEEGKTWLLGVVPYVGLPAKVLYPTWRALRRCCLLAAIYGFDLNEEDTRAKILQVFCGMRAVPLGEFALESAVQMVWTMIAGPVAGFVPVGVLASKVANVEGHVMGVVGHDTFTEGRRFVPPEEYEQELDPEPTRDDYLGLMKDTSVYALMLGRSAVLRARDVATDEERRGATAVMARDAAVSSAGWALENATVVGRGVVAAATAPDAKEKAMARAAEAADMGKEGLAKGFALGKALVSSKKSQA